MNLLMGEVLAQSLASRKDGGYGMFGGTVPYRWWVSESVRRFTYDERVKATHEKERALAPPGRKRAQTRQITREHAKKKRVKTKTKQNKPIRKQTNKNNQKQTKTKPNQNRNKPNQTKPKPNQNQTKPKPKPNQTKPKPNQTITLHHPALPYQIINKPNNQKNKKIN